MNKNTPKLKKIINFVLREHLIPLANWLIDNFNYNEAYKLVNTSISDTMDKNYKIQAWKW